MVDVPEVKSGRSYGASGQETGNKIVDAVKSYNKSHSSHPIKVVFRNKKFTLLNSANLKRATLIKLLKKYRFRGCYPKIEKQRDKAGNLIVVLSCDNPKKPPELGKRIVGGHLTNDPIKYSLDTLYGKEVAQGYAIITRYKKVEATYLQTSGLWSCIGVTIYDPKTKIGALAHIDDKGKAKDLNIVILILKTKGIPTNRLVANIIGGSGDWYSNETFESSKMVLSQNGIRINETNIGEQKSRPSGIQLNLDTGEVTAYKESIPYNNEITRSRVSISAQRLSINSEL